MIKCWRMFNNDSWWEEHRDLWAHHQILLVLESDIRIRFIRISFIFLFPLPVILQALAYVRYFEVLINS